MKIKNLWKRGSKYWFKKMVNGKLVITNLQTSDIQTAISRAAEISRGMQATSKDSLDVALYRVIEGKFLEKKIRKKTKDNMLGCVKLFLDWAGDIPLKKVDESMSARYVDFLRKNGLSEYSIQTYIRNLRSCFSELERGRLIFENPWKFKLPPLPRSPRRDFCTEAQRDALIENAPNDDLKLILMLGFFAGLRKNEIIEARPEWLDFERKCIHVEKTATFTPKDNDDRTIPMAKPLFEFLSAREWKGEYLLRPDVKKGRSNYRYDFKRPFGIYMKEQGCPEVTAHSMRRTFASILLINGKSIYKVAKWLGDGVGVVENSYGHLTAYDSDID